MPAGFSFRVNYDQTGEAFSSSCALGDAASFLAAIEAVRAAGPGRDQARVSQLLAGELRSRNIDSASPVMSRLMRQAPPDPDLYVPQPGQEPGPAQVITDPDLADRMPWLMELPPQSAMNGFS